MKTAEKTPLTPAQQRKRRLRRRALLRRGIQLAFFLLMPGAFVAGFSGVKALFQWIGAGEPLQFNSFVKVLVGLCLLTVLFGRYFCGYVCAFGSLGDFVWWLSGLAQKKLFHRKKQFSLPARLLPWGQKVKYGVLILIVIFCTAGLYGKLSGTSPWEVFSLLTAGRLPAGGYLAGILLFLLILGGMAVQERFFCQFLCPMGAVFSLLPMLPWGVLRRNAPNCIPGCNACANQCPVGLKLEEDGGRNGECIGCERCAGVCPKGNISHPEQRLLRREDVAVAIKAVLFFALGAWLGLCRFI